MTPPEEPPAAGEPPPADVGAECPNCGTPYQPGQEYCLNCGMRLPQTGGFVPVLRRTWQRHLPWYPGDWLWPVLLGLVIAAVAALIAILATKEKKSGKPFLVGTTPTVAGTTAGTVAAPPEQSGTLPAATQPAATSTIPGPPTNSSGLTEWPAATSGYTIVLSSVPTSGGSAGARRAAKKASDAGVTDVGILDSSGYSSLHPGYYVVFSGVFDSLAEAKSALPGVRSSGYPQAYPRRIAQ
jgi:zinc-ribbon domain